MQLARVLTGENGGALILLASKAATQGWQLCICSGTEYYRVHIAGFAISNVSNHAQPY